MSRGPGALARPWDLVAFRTLKVLLGELKGGLSFEVALSAAQRLLGSDKEDHRIYNMYT